MEEAMRVHVYSLDALAVHAHRQALPARRLLCTRRIEHRTTAERNAGCGSRTSEKLSASRHSPLLVGVPTQEGILVESRKVLPRQMPPACSARCGKGRV